ncbi:MAG: hypothetical protein H3C27_01450 [Opitutaceae bacterium]|nr:hypothetical protein [Opitutaceae bacterium]
MKPASPHVVHLTSRAAYFAIKFACSDRDLIGTIEKPLGNSPIVYLNAKDDLINLITAGGGNFRRVQLRPHSGHLPDHAGRGGSLRRLVP